jgi:transposase
MDAGVSLLNKGEYDRAIVDFNEAIRLDSRYASAFNNRGLAQWRKLDFDRAIADFAEVIRLSPKATIGYINRKAEPFVWTKKKVFKQAIEAAGAMLRYLPACSPDLNPIELAFSKLKAHLRQAAEHTIPGLLRRIGRVVRAFSPQECRNYFRHAGYVQI